MCFHCLYKKTLQDVPAGNNHARFKLFESNSMHASKKQVKHMLYHKLSLSRQLHHNPLLSSFGGALLIGDLCMFP